MIVCDNVGDHLVGNVYVRYRSEEEASKAADELNNRFYGGRPLYAELSPVTDFREACCRQFEMNECNRGGFCNFMHIKKPTDSLRQALFAAQRMERRLRRAQRERQREEERSGRNRRDEEDRRQLPVTESARG